MPRYSNTELDEIKQSVDLVALVQSKGIQLEKHGRDHLKGRCPFHDDNEPSLIVTPGKNLWNCPACQNGGDVIQFVMKHDGVSFRHAVELLRTDASAVMGGERKRSRMSVPKLKPPVELNADDHQQLSRVIDYYHTRLLETEPAQEYLKKRGICDPAAVKLFKLGYADRTLGLRLPDSNRQNGKELRGQLQKIGILRESGHEHLNGCLVIPVIEPHSGDLKSGSATGIITEVYGRKLDDSNKKRGSASHLYLPGPHKGIWNPAALKSKEIILTESLIDALTFWTCGLRNVTASYGTGGFTPDHLAAFIDNRIETVYIAYDRDDAGDNAANKLAAELTAEGIRCYRVLFPQGMDANAYARQVGSAQKHFNVLLNSAQFMDTTQGSAPNPAQGDCVPPRPPQQKSPRRGSAGSSDAGKPSPKAPAETVPAPQDGHSGEEVADSATSPEAKVEPATSSPNPSSQANPGSSRENFPRPPEAPKGIACKYDGEDVHVSLGERGYRVRGLARNTSFDVMKANIRVNLGELFHVDTLDLYNARHRKAFIHAAADECRTDAEVIKRDIGRVLLKLEELQEQNLVDATEPENHEVELNEDEQAEALELLREPQLLARIASDFELAGLVGEGSNALVAYLAAVSRKTDDPLAVIIQSSSSAGKSSVMDAVLSLMPDEEQIRYTAMTGQSLFYMGETELAHKVLAISEEEGAEQAGYALKILQSEKKLRIASTGKDPKTGRLVTQEYHVEGPCSIFMTTTSIEVDEELQNRCIVLTVNENREQTRRIHELQRQARTLSGLLRGEDKKRVLRIHRNAQRMLRPLLVVNPFAEQLTFADGRLRTRRDHMKYLNLINAVALLHQYQREVKTVNHQGKPLSYVEVTLDDIEAANKLAGDVMGTSLDDLPPQTRKLLMLMRELADELCEQREIERLDLRLMRREIREYTGWGNTQLGIHLERLVEHEYLAVYRGDRGRTLVYELLYQGEGQEGGNFMLNLVELEGLKGNYDNRNTGAEDRSTGHVRPKSAPSTDTPKTTEPASKTADKDKESGEAAEPHLGGEKMTDRRTPPVKQIKEPLRGAS